MTFKPVIFAMLFAVFAFNGYSVSIRYIPKLAMKKADAAFEIRGLPINGFGPPLKVTADNQTVVRSSPDLAYSICRIDLTKGPVEVRGGVWDGYASLTIFDENTDAIFVTSLDANEGTERGVLLFQKGMTPEKSFQKVIRHKGHVGDFAVALIRRLAPDDESYARAKEAAKDDICRPFQPN